MNVCVLFSDYRVRDRIVLEECSVTDTLSDVREACAARILPEEGEDEQARGIFFLPADWGEGDPGLVPLKAEFPSKGEGAGVGGAPGLTEEQRRGLVSAASAQVKSIPPAYVKLRRGIPAPRYWAILRTSVPSPAARGAAPGEGPPLRPVLF